MVATLDKPLREKYSVRSIEVRKGDEVLIMRGKFKGKKAKVTNVEVGNTRVNIDGMQITKKDGTKVDVWFHPSNLKIVSVVDSDKKRFKKTNTKSDSNKTKEAPKSESKMKGENK